ncbi:MAG: PQQ-dependent sugar dehydrogenase [Gammaproteobacteria bacterium]|nr:MAG: PQQ-dependent sugar dehydrogenase [Gammaproteobacteria bacterium]
MPVIPRPISINRHWLLLSTLLIGTLLLGCTSQSTEETTTSSTLDAPAPKPDALATAVAPSPNTSATTDGTITQTPTVRQTVLVDSLEHPWGLDWLPDGTIIVTERPGRVRLIRDGQLDPTPVAGVPNVLATGQGGLLDVAVHPQFAMNQWVYFTYAQGDRTSNQTRIARARLEGNTLSNWQEIFQVNRAKEGGQHFGSRITWLQDNTMLVSIGDGGNPPLQLAGDLIRNQAQELDSHLGKIVRLNDDGSIPTDNPFVDQPDVNPAIWSYGHRNIQGLMYDPVSDRIWSTEHGARGGDELNLIQAGGNYGWPVVTYSREYSGGEITTERSRPDMADPLVVWTPAIAPSGLLVYQGDAFPQWQGDLLAGGLVSQDIRHLDLDESGTVINETPIPIGHRVRDVRQGPDARIYILTDEPNGRLIRLDPG